MILFEIFQDEAHPAYQDLEIANGNRQYDFLRSLVLTSFAVNRLYLSSYLVKALNFHAITCLHVNAGEFRPCDVHITHSSHQPPAHYRVPALMEDFVNDVNRSWANLDPIPLAAYVLWRLNWIHPFINGNGRTARAASYLVLCAKLGGWLPGATILPELLRRERERYVLALRAMDQDGSLDPLIALMTELLIEQLGLHGAAAPPAAPAGQEVIALPGPSGGQAGGT